MRCKKHLSDRSSTIGVCASCLRDRLLYLIDQQSRPSIQLQNQPQIRPISQNPNPKPNQPQAPPLIFPRSVSPYITPRKSDPIQRFHSTPQVGCETKKKKQNLGGKLGLIARLFRSRSQSSNSTVLARRSKGMSPENELDTAESSPARWVNRPSPARVRPSPSRAASMAFCLSPLVRASPARNWGNNEAFAGEIRVPVTGKCENKPHLSEAASFSGNRSRKLADFGRLNPNR